MPFSRPREDRGAAASPTPSGTPELGPIFATAVIAVTESIRLIRMP